jgi:hypothetical protein
MGEELGMNPKEGSIQLAWGRILRPRPIEVLLLGIALLLQPMPKPYWGAITNPFREPLQVVGKKTILC